MTQKVAAIAAGASLLLAAGLAGGALAGSSAAPQVISSAKSIKLLVVQPYPSSTQNVHFKISKLYGRVCLSSMREPVGRVLGRQQHRPTVDKS